MFVMPKIRVDIFPLDQHNGRVIVCESATDAQLVNYLQTLPIDTLRKITQANFAESGIGDETVKFILLNCPHLQALDISNTHITLALTDFMRNFAGLPELEDLNLSFTCFSMENTFIFSKNKFPKLNITIHPESSHGEEKPESPKF